MKKLLSVTLALLMAFSAFPLGMVSFAETESNSETESGLTGECSWKLEGTKLTISGNGKMDDYDEIDAPWSMDITELVIEKGVTKIGEKAFQNCKKLKSVVILDGVTTIERKAFNNCRELASISLPDSVQYISSSAFTDTACYNDASNWSDSVLYFGKHLIAADYDEIEGSYTVKDGTLTIAPYAFSECYELTSVVVPDSVKYIGSAAFQYCNALNNITLPSSAVSIGAYAFDETEYYSNSENWDDGNVLYIGKHLIKADTDMEGSYTVKEGTLDIAEKAFEYCRNLTEAKLPETLTVIGDYAFHFCDNISSLNIPSKLKSIGAFAFRYCPFNNVTLPKTLEYIGPNAFCGYVYDENFKLDAENKCFKLVNNCIVEVKTKTLVVGFDNGIIPTDGSVTHIGDYAFGERNIENVIIPEGVTSIGEGAFGSCGNITSIRLPDSVVYIGKQAFDDCGYLETLELSESINAIRASTFNYLTNLKSITIPKKVTYIAENAFSNCKKLQSVQVPKSVASLGDAVFSGCESLESLTVEEGNKTYYSKNNCVIETASKTLVLACKASVIPNDGSITSIGRYAFYETDITAVTIPNGVTSIGKYAFKECAKLKTVAFPETLESIADYAFEECVELESVALPSGIESLGYAAFRDAEKLENITLPSTNMIISSRAFDDTAFYDNPANWEDGALYIGKHLIETDSEILATDYTVKDGTVTIVEDAFHSNGLLEKLQLPSSLKTIGEEAFSYCTNLASINLPQGVEAIGDYAFNSCSRLESVEIPKSVKHIGYGAFMSCGNLASIALPDTVEYLGGDIVYLTEYYDSDSNWQNGALYIGKNLLNVNEKASGVFVVKEGTINIPDEVFYKCKNLTAVTIPQSVTFIGSDAFNGCSHKLIIYGKTGSYAEKFAKEAYMSFVVCKHKKTETIGKKVATCTSAGCTGDIYCSDCGELVSKSKAIAATGHKTTVVGKKAATCTSAGYTGDTKCTVCGTVTAKGKTIAATGHKTKTVVTKATTKANGKTVTTCTVCKKVTKTVTINKIASVKLSATKYVYSGKAKTPSVVVKDSKGKTLKKGTDYTVTYASGRKNVGKYTVKVTFKGNYSGSKTLSFTIVPKSTKLDNVTAGSKKLTVKWNKQATQTSGYQVQYSTSKSFKSAKTVTVSGAKKTSKTIKSLKAKKTYYVRVRTYKTVGKTKYYSAWSSAENAKPKK